MTEPEKGQSQGAASAEPEKPGGLKGVWEGDFFQKGLETFDEAALKTAKKSDEECPECVKERLAKEAAEKAKAAPPEGKKPPYKIIKVQGREYAVESEDEMVALAQMGMDYRKKTQALADEKRALEGGLPDQLKASITRFNELADRLEKANVAGTREGAAAKVDAPPAEEIPLHEKYGYDPEMVDPHVPKLATALETANKKLASLEQSNKLFFLDKIVNTIQGTITHALKEYPLEDIKDEAGKSVTWPQFVGTLQRLIEDPANEKRSIPEMTVEAVKSIHLSQKTLRERSAGEAKAEAPSDDMPLEEIRTKFPKLYERISDQAVAVHAAKAGELPPNPKSRGAEVTAKTVEKKPYVEGRKFRETLDAGFEDPEVLAALGIQNQ